MIRAFLWLLAATALYAAIFLIFPGIDRWVQQWVVGADGRFLLAEVRWATLVNRSINLLMAAVLLVAGGLAIRTALAGPWHGIGLRAICYVAAVFLIGPVLLTNLVFKDQWGRARPIHVEASPEVDIFTPPLVLSDACPRNCSFPSGDAAAAFALLAPAFILPRRWRPLAIATVLAVGSFYGGIRILQGAHYFSDVIFAGLLSALVATGLHPLFFGRRARAAAAESR